MKHFKHFLLLLLVSLFFATLSPPFSVADQQKIILYPFAINADKDMNFLQKGVADMIETKLEEEHFLVVIEKESLDEESAIKNASEHSGDYVITGSLTFFGNTLSTSAEFIDAKTGNALVSYNKTDKNKDNLFEHIEAFTDRVIKSQKSENTLPEPVATSVEPTITPSAEGTAILSTPIFKSDRIKTIGNSLSLGDVNGDGSSEIVFTDKNSVYVSTYKDGKFEIEATIKGKNYLNNLYVDTGDFNQNGKAEIFVSCIHASSKKTMSYILEWNGSAYEQIITKSDWFYRSGKNPNTGKPALLGQQQHFANNVFSDTIHELAWDNDKKNYIPAKKINLPLKQMNIYKFDSGDVYNSEKNFLISYVSGGRLAVTDFDDKENWKSSTRFGGSNKYIEPRKQENQERLYMPPRIVADDVDANGVTDIITVMNHNSTPRVFSNLKNYTEGHIQCLTWKTLTFEPKWATQHISGYIPDFFIGDVDSNGKNDLIYLVVAKSGSFFKKKYTYLVIQPLTE